MVERVSADHEYGTAEHVLLLVASRFSHPQRGGRIECGCWQMFDRSGRGLRTSERAHNGKAANDCGATYVARRDPLTRGSRVMRLPLRRARMSGPTGVACTSGTLFDFPGRLHVGSEAACCRCRCSLLLLPPSSPLPLPSSPLPPPSSPLPPPFAAAAAAQALSRSMHCLPSPLSVWRDGLTFPPASLLWCPASLGLFAPSPPPVSSSLPSRQPFSDYLGEGSSSHSWLLVLEKRILLDSATCMLLGRASLDHISS